MRFCARAMLRGATAVIAIAVAGPFAAAATQHPPLPKSSNASQVDPETPAWAQDEGRKLHFFSSLIAALELDRLEEAMAQYPFTGKFAEQRTRFFKAAILRRRGQPEEAVRIYRDMLAKQPELGRVRAELAATLYEMEDDDAAKHHLNRLLSANANDANRKVFQNLLDHIDERRPWQFGGYLTLAPSTNFKKGSRHKTIALGPFTLDIDNKEESGLGLKGGLYGSYNYKVTEDLSIIAAGAVAHSEYPGSDFDDTQLSGNLEVRRTNGPDSVGVAITSFRRWLGGEGHSHAVGPRLTVKKQLTPRVAVRTTLDYMEKRYDDAKYLNGRDFNASVRATVGIAPQEALFLLYGATRSVSKLDHNKYWGGYGGLGHYREWPWGITTYNEARLHQYYYDSTYPNKTAPRRDTRLAFVSSVTKRDWNFKGFAPRLEYTLTHGISNVEFYDFTEHGVNLTVTRDF